MSDTLEISFHVMFPDQKGRATQVKESVHVISGCTVTWSALNQRRMVKKGLKKPETKPTGRGVRQLPHGTITFFVCVRSREMLLTFFS